MLYVPIIQTETDTMATSLSGRSRAQLLDELSLGTS